MDVEQRARKLLAEIANLPLRASDDAVIALIIAALTPPEGFVLVPVEPIAARVEAAAKALHAHGADSLCSDIPWDSLHQSAAEQFRGWARAAMRAARPEVP